MKKTSRGREEGVEGSLLPARKDRHASIITTATGTAVAAVAAVAAVVLLRLRFFLADFLAVAVAAAVVA